MIFAMNLYDPTDTRSRLLDVAERLFMEKGFEGTSVRQITGEAGVNLASANYHFGSKEALLKAVFTRRLEWLNRERIRVLDTMEAQAGGRPLKPSQIVDAFFGTLLRMGSEPDQGGQTFLRLLGRTITSPSEMIHTLFAGEYGDVLERFKVALYRALPDVPKSRLCGVCISCWEPPPMQSLAPMPSISSRIGR